MSAASARDVSFSFYRTLSSKLLQGHKSATLTRLEPVFKDGVQDPRLRDTVIKRLPMSFSRYKGNVKLRFCFNVGLASALADRGMHVEIEDPHWATCRATNPSGMAPWLPHQSFNH